VAVPGRFRSRVAGVAALAVLVVLVVVPLLPGTSNATLLTLTLMLTSIGVAVNWNLTGGFTGYVDFGHAVWFGIGAYGTAILMSPQSNGPQVGWPAVPSILVGAAAAGVLAAVIGRATMRLKGPYFSIAMLGTFVAVREIVRVWGGLTGGGVGLTLPPYLNRELFYYLELALVLALVAFSWWLRRTRFGTALVAIREDEVGAETRGIDTTRLKTAVFSFAGASTGLFGALWAFQNTFVDPDIAFVEVRTIDAVMGTVLGGLGTVAGPVLGAAALYWLRETLWSHLLDYHLLVQGVLLIIIVLFVPRGLVGLVDRRGTSLNELWGLKGRWPGRAVAPAPGGASSAQPGGASSAQPGGASGAQPGDADGSEVS
jgi:branched-chain amino acid transport system permease protein